MEPKNAQAVKEILRVSMYDPVQYEKFKTAAAIESNFKHYLNEHINYDKVFLACLDLIVGENPRNIYPDWYRVAATTRCQREGYGTVLLTGLSQRRCGMEDLHELHHGASKEPSAYIR